MSSRTEDVSNFMRERQLRLHEEMRPLFEKILQHIADTIKDAAKISVGLDTKQVYISSHYKPEHERSRDEQDQHKFLEILVNDLRAAGLTCRSREDVLSLSRQADGQDAHREIIESADIIVLLGSKSLMKASETCFVTREEMSHINERLHKREKGMKPLVLPAILDGSPYESLPRFLPFGARYCDLSQKSWGHNYVSLLQHSIAQAYNLWGHFDKHWRILENAYRKLDARYIASSEPETLAIEETETLTAEPLDKVLQAVANSTTSNKTSYFCYLSEDSCGSEYDAREQWTEQFVSMLLTDLKKAGVRHLKSTRDMFLRMGVSLVTETNKNLQKDAVDNIFIFSTASMLHEDALDFNPCLAMEMTRIEDRAQEKTPVYSILLSGGQHVLLPCLNKIDAREEGYRHILSTILSSCLSWSDPKAKEGQLARIENADPDAPERSASHDAFQIILNARFKAVDKRSESECATSMATCLVRQQTRDGLWQASCSDSQHASSTTPDQCRP